MEGTRELVVPGTPYILLSMCENALEGLRVFFHAIRKWPGSPRGNGLST